MLQDFIQPKYLNIPLPPGVAGVEEALDYLSDFGKPVLEGYQARFKFKYWKPTTLMVDLATSASVLTIALIYSENHAQTTH